MAAGGAATGPGLVTIASAVFLIYTVVSIDGVATFISSGAVGFAFGPMWIAQLPLLIGALWLLFRPAANQDFRKPRV
jgi:hypothetical protein